MPWRILWALTDHKGTITLKSYRISSKVKLMMQAKNPSTIQKVGLLYKRHIIKDTRSLSACRTTFNDIAKKEKR